MSELRDPQSEPVGTVRTLGAHIGQSHAQMPAHLHRKRPRRTCAAPHQALPQHQARRIHIRCSGGGGALPHLGRHVVHSTHDLPGAGRSAAVGGSGDSKVEQSNRRIVGDEDVGRLHVAVNHAFAVGVAEPLQHLGADVDDVVWSELSGCRQHRREVAAVQALQQHGRGMRIREH